MTKNPLDSESKFADFITYHASPHCWLQSAESLAEQALTIRKARGDSFLSLYKKEEKKLTKDVTDKSAFLLIGFAVENLIKAHLIYENPSWVSNGSLSRDLLSHDLKKLANKSKNIAVDKRDQEFLTILNLGLLSWARYPCGKSFKDTGYQPEFYDQLWDNCIRFLKENGSKLMEILENGWEGPHETYERWEFKGDNFCSQ
jgi:hypothetical protein